MKELTEAKAALGPETAATKPLGLLSRCKDAVQIREVVASISQGRFQNTVRTFGVEIPSGEGEIMSGAKRGEVGSQALYADLSNGGKPTQDVADQWHDLGAVLIEIGKGIKAHGEMLESLIEDPGEKS